MFWLFFELLIILTALSPQKRESAFLLSFSTSPNLVSIGIGGRLGRIVPLISPSS